MTVMNVLARAEAVAGRRAVPAATVRHRWVAERPLVLVPLTTAGEAGAPLGAMIGTDRDAPALLVVPQPLDRELRFGFFAGLAAALLPVFDGYADVTETEPATRNREETEVCADAPQLVVPNSAALEYVRLLGRSTRYLRTVEDPEAPHPVPVPVPLLGRWLTHYAERARTPGSGLLVAMTDLLTRHWATGQSAMEDQHLGALLGWIDPPPGLDGPAAASRAQTGRAPDGLLLSPPAGPATDPVFDNRVLAPALARYDKARTAAQRAAGNAAEGRQARQPQPQPQSDQALTPAGHRAAVVEPAAEPVTGTITGSPAGTTTEPVTAGIAAERAVTAGVVAERAAAELAAAEADVRRLVASQLQPTWDDVWRGLDLLRALPEGAHVTERWKRDRWSFTGHRDRLAAGEPPQPKRDDAITAAQKLAGRETAQARLQAQEALDDPLVMASRRLTGEAFTGRVAAVEMTYSEGRRPMPRPLLTIATDDLPQAEPGTKAYRALPDAKSAQSAELLAVAPTMPTEDADAGSPAGPAAGSTAWTVTVKLTGGMGSGRTPREGSVPEPGEVVTFTFFEHDPRGGPALPEAEQTPWTHGGPPGAGTPAAAAGAAPEPDPVTPEDFL